MRGFRIYTVLAVLMATTLQGAAQDADAMLAGRVSVVDGDTLELHGQRIRLFGIDAPEDGQTCETNAGKAWRCGTEAALLLDDLVAGRTIRCQPRDVDRYGRVVAVCFAGQTDLAEQVVTSGLALAFRRYSQDYVSEENRARRAKIGMWAGRFISPSDWRKAQRQ